MLRVFLLLFVLTVSAVSPVRGDEAAASVFHCQKYTLTADHLSYSQVTDTVEGVGHAKLVCPTGNTVLGYQITVPNCHSLPLGPLSVVGKSSLTIKGL